MRSFIFLLIGAILLPFSSIIAQDSLQVQWKAVVQNTVSGSVEIKYEGVIAKGYHIYAGANQSLGLMGITVTLEDSADSTRPIIFNTPVSLIKDPLFEQAALDVVSDSVSFTQTYFFGKTPSMVRVKLSYEVGSADNFLQEEKQLSVILGSAPSISATNRIRIESIDINHPVTDCTTSGEVSTETRNAGLLHIFLLGFLGGLVALLTPCVFPMIPLTVSFFTKKASTKAAGVRNAGLYAFFILLIYVILSLPFHFLDRLDPEILNNISTNVWLNVIFFFIFLVFAFSFFGFYEITLPASLSSKADSKAGTGNIIGIFFMALTLSLVSFSCTGPILGSLLAGSLSGDGGAMQLTSGMAGFGLALALPFGLFALFPNWLHSLPKSGGWLDVVKKVLGFLELALSVKFLSNADMVKHWGLLKREIFIGSWILTGILLAAYLFGWLRFKSDGPKQAISPVRKFFGFLTLAFTLYLMPGITNTSWANLKLISGFPPPLYYSIYEKKSECVLDLNCTHDYESALALAKKENKPLLIDFTGYACVNCRKMEESIWSTPEIYTLMKNDFVVVSLYVDDKKALPAADRFTYVAKDGTEKYIRTVGDKWATFETENFSNNAQPWYAILDNKERLLTHPVGYTPSADEYLAWLKCGLEAFRAKK